MTNRREFLSLPGIVLGAPARKVTVGAHPWVYAATRPGYDIYPILDRIFADMSYAGIEAIELMHTALLPDQAVRRIAALSRRHALPVLGMSYSADMWRPEAHAAIVEETRRLVGRLAETGGRTLGISVGDARRMKTAAELDAQAGVLQKVMEICASSGVTPNLHNHIYEVASREHDLRGTLERIPGIKLGPDLDWLVGAGVDPLDFIRRHGRRIVFAHLRDRAADGSWVEAMGEGSLKYAAFGQALREAGFQGDVAIELAHPRGFAPTRPLRESLKMSREYVRRQMGW
ncbi:MAG: sugar phosphate isomerase/epimerase [Bryobacterales bacterium]|nr:sugar phosphate isomerase/epimerase [Bryobacterales bacterium]